MSSYEDFVASHNEKMAALLDKQFEQLLVAAAKHLKAHDDFKHYTQKALVEMMKGGDAPIVKKPAKKAAKKQTTKADETEDDEIDYPKGMTATRWTTICGHLADLEDGQFVNVKTGKVTKKNARNKDTYYWRKHFCAPLALKQLVLWAARNEPELPAAESVEDEFENLEDEDEVVLDDSSEEDQPPRRRGHKAPVEDTDDDESEDQPPRRRGHKTPVEDTDDDESEDEAPRRRGGRKPAKAKVVDSDVEEDSDEESEDEAPRRGGRKPAKAKVVDSDEESEDEAPRRRGGRKPAKAKVVDSDEELCDGFTQKDLVNLRKAAAKAKANGSYVNAATRRSCGKNKANEKRFSFYKAGYAVEKSNEDLIAVLDEHF